MREFASDDRIAAYVSRRTGITLAPGQWTALGILQDGIVQGGAVFTHFTGHDISVTMAAEHPRVFTKEFLSLLGLYVYDQLGCSRVSITTEQPRVAKIAMRHGAEIEGLKRDQFGPGRDGILLGLLARDWMFTKRSGSDPLQAGVK